MGATLLLKGWLITGEQTKRGGETTIGKIRCVNVVSTEIDSGQLVYLNSKGINCTIDGWRTSFKSLAAMQPPFCCFPSGKTGMKRSRHLSILMLKPLCLYLACGVILALLLPAAVVEEMR